MSQQNRKKNISTKTKVHDTLLKASDRNETMGYNEK